MNNDQLWELATATRKDLDRMAGETVTRPIGRAPSGIAGDRLFYLDLADLDRMELNRMITFLAVQGMVITWVNPTNYIIGMCEPTAQQHAAGEVYARRLGQASE